MSCSVILAGRPFLPMFLTGSGVIPGMSCCAILPGRPFMPISPGPSLVPVFMPSCRPRLPLLHLWRPFAHAPVSATRLH